MILVNAALDVREPLSQGRLVGRQDLRVERIHELHLCSIELHCPFSPSLTKRRRSLSTRPNQLIVRNSPTTCRFSRILHLLHRLDLHLHHLQLNLVFCILL